MNGGKEFSGKNAKNFSLDNNTKHNSTVPKHFSKKFLTRHELENLKQGGVILSSCERKSRRCRHPSYVLAHREVKKKRGVMDLFLIRQYAENYLSDLNRARVMLECEYENYRFCLFLEPNSLLYSGYHRRLLSRFKLIDMYQGVGITLTLRSLEFFSVYDDTHRIKRYWNNLLIKLKRKYPYWSGDYFSILEIGKKSLMTHLHIILFGLKYVNHKWLSECWKDITKSSYVVYVSRNSKNVRQYISKYLSKSIRGVLDDSVILIWACGVRLWSCSRGLFDKLKQCMKLLKRIDVDYTIWLVDCRLDGLYIVYDSDDYG